MDPLLTSVIGGAVNGLTGLLGMSGQAHYQRRNMREAAALQHAENVYWAEYNTPENQMARLRAAGLNPMLVYGNGADAQSQGSVSPSGGMPSGDFKLGSDILMMQNMQEQNKLLKAQQEKAESEADLAAAHAEKIRNETPYVGDFLKSQAERNRSEVALAGIRGTFMEAQEQWTRIKSDIEREFGADMARATLRSIDVQNEIKDIEKSKLPKMLEAQYHLTREQAKQCDALVSLYNAQVKQLEEYTLYLKEQKKLAEQQGQMFDIRKETAKIRKNLLGLQAINQTLKNKLDEWSIPARVINEYLSPANLVVSGLSGIGVNMKGMFKVIDSQGVPSDLVPHTQMLDPYHYNPFESSDMYDHFGW